MQYPRKAYFVDNGFLTMLSDSFSPNYGRLCENAVFGELKRRSGPQTKIYYWRDEKSKEVDFVVKEGLKIQELMQVSWDISSFATAEREIKNLLRAGKELNCNRLILISESKEAVEKIGGQKIVFIPLWKWLLEQKRP